MKRKILILSALFVFSILFLGWSYNYESMNSIYSISEEQISGIFFGLDTKEIHKEFKVSKGQKLKLELKIGADIEVNGWNKDIVEVDVKLKGDDAEYINIDFKESSSGVKVRAEYDDDEGNWDASAKFIVKVPNVFDLEFDTMGGDVDLDGVDGELSGTTMGGDLNLSHLKGKLELSTMGGDIKLTDSDVDGYVKTMGGDVTIENVVGDINAKSMGGDIIQKNVKRRVGDSVGEEVNIITMGGDLQVDEAANGAKLKTMGGDISVNYVGEFLEAETMGGDIIVQKADGWIKAKTMGGDVKVKLVCNPDDDDKDVALVSMGGDIELIVPENFSMDLELEIAFTSKYEGRVKIESDFDFDEEITDEWKRDNGNKRKYIYGTGSVRGGKNKVKIKTINGNIYLKKI
ncbi:DUF4097 domain-containing protein [Bacteroidota bacterium]